MNIEELGFTNEEVIDRVVNNLADRLLTSVFTNEYGDPVASESTFRTKMNALIKKRIDERISFVAEQYVLPKVDDMVENLLIQNTNNFGEKRGEPVTFIEYMTAQASAYMKEPVDSNGKSRTESQSSMWRQKGTRIASHVDKSIQHEMEAAMKKIISDANSEIAAGMVEAVRTTLNDIKNRIKLDVKAR